MMERLRLRGYEFVHGDGHREVFDMETAMEFALRVERKGWRAYVVYDHYGRYVVAMRPKLRWLRDWDVVAARYRGYYIVKRDFGWVVYDSRTDLCGWYDSLRKGIMRVNQIHYGS